MAIWNERIKNRRKELGLTLLDVANKIGVTEATAQRYESGKIKKIPHENICAYAEILDCTPAYLMGWEDKEAKEDFKLISEQEEMRKKAPDAFADADLLMDIDEDEEFKSIYPSYRKLNELGKKAVKDRVEELVQIDKYTAPKVTTEEEELEQYAPYLKVFAARNGKDMPRIEQLRLIKMALEFAEKHGDIPVQYIKEDE